MFQPKQYSFESLNIYLQVSPYQILSATNYHRVVTSLHDKTLRYRYKEHVEL